MRRYREDAERIVKVRGIYVRRPMAVPFRVTASDHLKDAGEVLLGLLVLLALFLGIPFLLFVVAGGA